MLVVKRKYKLLLETLFWILFFTATQIYLKKSKFPFKKGAQELPEVKQLLCGETLDYSGQYRIIRFFRFNGLPTSYRYQDVTLVTQCSVNHLHHLAELAQKWNGPISCSVFVPNTDASVASDAISLLKKCYPKIDEHVTFHLVFPSKHHADVSQKGQWDDLTCEDLLEKLENYGYQNYVVGDLAFPHNVLRNVARSGVLTEFVFLVDVDVIPNVGLRNKFLKFAHRRALFGKDDVRGNLTAYVVPVFEIKRGLPFPVDKQELLGELSKETVRPFHNETCWWCHRAENINKWKDIPQRLDDLDVGFEAEWDKSWEPFYFTQRTVPMFDERFKQYGFDRIQQICEMHVAGYKFVVLDNAFLTHQGWKFAGKFYANKDADNAQNWILFNYHFKDDLQQKYKTNRTCSPLEDVDFKTKFAGRRNMPMPGKSVVLSRFNRPFGVG